MFGVGVCSDLGMLPRIRRSPDIRERSRLVMAADEVWGLADCSLVEMHSPNGAKNNWSERYPHRLFGL